MDIEEAIKELNKARPPAFWGENPGLEKAHQLGIEALKRELHKRQTMALNEEDFLPGETKGKD